MRVVEVGAQSGECQVEIEMTVSESGAHIDEEGLAQNAIGDRDPKLGAPGRNRTSTPCGTRF